MLPCRVRRKETWRNFPQRFGSASRNNYNLDNSQSFKVFGLEHGALSTSKRSVFTVSKHLRTPLTFLREYYALYGKSNSNCGKIICNISTPALPHQAFHTKTRSVSTRQKSNYCIQGETNACMAIEASTSFPTLRNFSKQLRAPK